MKDGTIARLWEIIENRFSSEEQISFLKGSFYLYKKNPWNIMPWILAAVVVGYSFLIASHLIIDRIFGFILIFGAVGFGLGYTNKFARKRKKFVRFWWIKIRKKLERDNNEKKKEELQTDPR